MERYLLLQTLMISLIQSGNLTNEHYEDKIFIFIIRILYHHWMQR